MIERLEKSRKDSSERKDARRKGRTIWIAFLVLSVPALIGLILFSLTIHHGWEKFAVGLLTAAASFAAGALVGFLFGIPRYLAMASAQAPSTGAAGPASSSYVPNTNLEEISDWLTKILVGAGLVQIGQLGHTLGAIGSGLEENLGIGTKSIAIALIVAFSIAGFLTSYLFTRLRLQEVMEPLKEALEDQEKNLTDALPLVREQLDPSGEKDPSQTDLEKALYKASSGIRDEAFYLARNQRRANWRGKDARGEDRSLVDLVIPVFKALVSLDEEEKYHRNRGELGYAFKDAVEHDYGQAVEQLTEAIKLRDRDPTMRNKFPFYEFNRAIAAIKLEEKDGEPTKAVGPKVAERIKRDLEVAKKDPKTKTAFKEQAALLRDWHKANPDPK